MYKIIENENEKILISENYNFTFNKKDGFFVRWGKSIKDDPSYSPAGPEILDLEISSGGDCLGNCSFCYKSNGGKQPTHNMSLETFKNIFGKMPKTLTQIAFGIMNISTNPDFFSMMEYARDNGVIPNYTTHGLDVTDEIAEKTAKLCGAVAVSVVNRERSYDSIKKFTDAGMNQVNIHYMLSEETFDRAFEIVDDIISDPRLKKLNAIVFLQLKSKGRAKEVYHSISTINKYKELIQYCDARKIRYGMDSCSAPLYFKAIEGRSDRDKLTEYAEPCESALFSSYINCKGDFYPCSFMEGEYNWEEGVSVIDAKDFVKDIWNNERTVAWRDTLLLTSANCSCIFKNICRSCPTFEVSPCKGVN